MTNLLVFVVSALLLCNIINLLYRRPPRFVPYVVLGTLVAISATNTQNVDSAIYRVGYYYGVGLRPLEWGYKCLADMAYSAGLDFETFRSLLVAGGFVVLHLAVAKQVTQQASFYLLYAVYPFLLDIVQVRNFVSFAVVTLALVILVHGRGANRVLFIGLVLIAASFQAIALFYLPAVYLVRPIPRLLVRSWFAIVAAACVASVYFRDRLSSLVAQFSTIDGRLDSYSTVQTRMGFLVPWAIWLTGIVSVYFASRLLSRAAAASPYDARLGASARFSSLVLRLNGWAAASLPLFLLNPTFERLLRDVAPLNLMVFLAALGVRDEATAARPLIWLGWAAVISLQLALFLTRIVMPFGAPVVEDPFLLNRIWGPA